MTGWFETQFKFIRLSFRLVCLAALADFLPTACAVFASGDTPRPSIYSYDVWQAEEGEEGAETGSWVPDTVTSILQSTNGYLWMGTYQGLVRYDGVNFALFDAVQWPGLQNNRITALYEDDVGTLWIGHETGELSRLSGGEFQRVQPGQNWPGGPVEEIETDENNDVWILNEAGVLFRVRDGKRLESPGGLSTTRRAALSRERNGRLWLVANGLVSRMEQGELKAFQFPDASPSDFYERVAPAHDGGLWVVGNGKIRKWTGNQWGQDLGDCPCGHNHFVSALKETRAGNLLVGTVDDGLYVVEPGADILHFSRANNRLSHDWIRGLCEDREGNIWLGTGAGLNALRPRKVRMLEPPDHFQGRAVRSFSVLPDGSAWVGTEGAGLYHYDHNAWTSYTESSGLSNLFVWTVLVTQPGELFVGTWGGGCFMKQGERFEQVGELSRITNAVVALYEGQEGEVWLGTTLGVYRYQNGKLTFVAGKDEMSSPDVRAIAQSPDGTTMWFGLMGGGVARLSGGKIQQFRKADGLSSDYVQCLYADPDGSLWIGTSDNGICRWKQGKFRTLSSEHGLPAMVICHIANDGSGNLWFSSNRGVFSASKADLELFVEHKTNTLECLRFGKAEGMASLICSGGFQPGTCRTTNGLWVPTAKGIATIDPAHMTVNQEKPPVVIETLLADGHPMMTDSKSGAQSSSDQAELGTVDSNGRLNIPPGKQPFEIRYTALSFTAPKKVRFKYKLEGWEKDWIDAGNKRAAPYTYLPPGPYTFRVKACNNDEKWNDTGASLAFYVLPEFWQTWWFKVVALLAGAGAVAGAVMAWMRHRVRLKLEQLERQRVVERERARIARDIHDDLGASLTHITLLSQSARGELEESHTAAEDMDQIYTTARELTRAMDEIVWAVNPKHDTLESLIAYLARFAQNFLSGTGLRCRLDMPVQLPSWTLTSEIRHNVFLASKEALNNVVKHAHATEVRLSLELTPSAFVIVVGDNGQGFELQKPNGHPPGGADELRVSGGNGLQNMQRRLSEVGGQCEWKTAPHEGTKVRMTIQVNGSVASSKEMTGVILDKER